MAARRPENIYDRSSVTRKHGGTLRLTLKVDILCLNKQYCSL